MKRHFALATVLILAVLSLGTAGCASRATLSGTSWRLTEFGAQTAIIHVLAGTAVTLGFNSDGSRVSGNGGCNDYFGDCLVDSESLAISNLGATKKACADPPGIMNQESAYFGLMGKAERFQLKGDTLTIYCAGNQTLLFDRVKNLSGATGLSGTSWALVSYGDPTALKSIITGTHLTLKFNSDTTHISGTGGVNGFGGDCMRTDNQLTFSNIMSTLMASTDPAINEQETAYFALLNTAQSVSFGEGALTIYCSSGELHFVSG